MKPGWRAAFPDQSAIAVVKNQWLMALMEAGISDWSTIEGGLAELRQSQGPFLPSTGDFIALCRKASLKHWKIPSEPEAFSLLQRFFGPRHIKRDFTQLNPAVYAAYCHMDWSVVSQMPTKEQKAAFREAWKRVMQDLADGKRLPDPPAQDRVLEEKPTRPCDRGVALSALGELKSLLAGEQTTAERA
ncbi:replication protein P [Microbulbifer sp. 2201CG32-9]|uniref:replication protein P n=1 Tax=Microbulbifer sp. 2201CG32-9 TaxID=3232309 RepID=UPI00345B85D9